MANTPKETAIQALSELGVVNEDRTKPLHVREVDLGKGGNAVSDNILPYLQEFPELQNLYLDKTAVTDKVLAVLKSCSGLKQLGIDGTQITDQGLKNLKHCQALEMLILGDQITDQGVSCLSGLTTLKYLDIAQTAVTDRGLAAIRNLINLEFLALSGPQVSAKSVLYLKGLPKLARIRIVSKAPDSSSLITAALPKVQIE